MLRKSLLVLGAMAVTLLAPFLLRPGGQKFRSSNPEKLIIVSPHVESIRMEFTRAFQRWLRENHSREADIQWLTPGGTSEIDRYLDTEFRAAFENHWRKTQSEPWQSAYAAAVAQGKLPENASAGLKNAREVFLNSDLGVRIDLFFGGGVYDFEKQKKKGYLVATDAGGVHGLSAIKRRHPEWFTEEVIPQSFAGSPYYDKGLCWVGNCLSAYGVLYNKDVLQRLNIYKPPEQWADLADPVYNGLVALADPGKSGSAAQAFEMVVQQQMQLAVAEAKREAAKPSDPTHRVPTVEEAKSKGWARGLQLIQKIAANARYFTDAAPKPPQDVARGDAAAGMCIDFYGRTYVEKLTEPGGYCRVAFASPKGGSAVTVDPIAMFRGAPNPELATLFMEFVLGMEGQRLWGNRAGTPGGPERAALRRLPVRKDYYVPKELANAADPDELPYQKTTFHYESDYTQLNPLRFVIRVMCLDTQDELKAAWQALRENKFPAKAVACFENMSLVGYDKAMGEIARDLAGSDKIKLNRLALDLADSFRHTYKITAELAARRE
ncbi:MAG: extracellular solute-binding protein [Verrucomicrobiales bacterium]|nr:extracellular solute-binding protein [Verrucomicrobiales bacterium]